MNKWKSTTAVPLLAAGLVLTSPQIDLERMRIEFVPKGYTQVVILPPPPPLGGSSSAAGGGSGGAAGAAGLGVTVAAIVYVARGMVGVYHIGLTEKRQATACEFLTWPLDAVCGTTQREKYVNRVRFAFDKLPFRLEQHFFDVSGDRKAWTYPSTAQMVRVLKANHVVVK